MGDDKPLFAQIAAELEDQIVSGVLVEGGLAPSTNALASFYRVNPATAAKGLHLLLEEGLLERRRGIGMVVVTGARRSLLARRRRDFAEDFVQPLVAEALALDVPLSEAIAEVADRYQNAQAFSVGAVERERS